MAAPFAPDDNRKRSVKEGSIGRKWYGRSGRPGYLIGWAATERPAANQCASIPRKGDRFSRAGGTIFSPRCIQYNYIRIFIKTNVVPGG
jgi:hypothetical protein